MTAPDTHPPRLAPVIGLVALGLLLVGGFLRVLEKRFATGDVYPHYSTLRSDPLGSRALHDSLAALPGLTVSRNYRPLMNLRTLDADSTLWLGGLEVETLGQLRAPEDSPVLAAIRDGGARLVITLDPRAAPAFGARSSIANEEESDDEGEEDDPAGKKLTQLLGVRVTPADKPEAPDDGWPPRPGENAPEDLPAWRAPHRFTDLDGAWRVAARVGDDPVVIERSFGSGTVVMASDSYFASNEALWREASPGFLLWLIGGKTRLIFDETLHGSVESGGAMKMIRRYRFHGFLIGLLILVALLAWRGGTSLTPGSETLERGLVGDDAVLGEDAASGLERLLRRNIPPSRLPRTCVSVWRDSAGRRHRTESESRRREIDALLAEHERDPRHPGPVETIRRISRLLRLPH